MSKPHLDWENTRPDPFISWLHAHGLIQPGATWTAEMDPTGQPVYRRSAASVGVTWPANKIAGPLVVRPKRRALELT